jgi:hypothetical protein
MTGFLGPADFEKNWPSMYTLPSSPFTKGGRATYEGNIVFTNLDKKHVACVLPDTLELAPNASDVHPVLYMIGHLEDIYWEINDVPQISGDEYDEMILAIPFVRKRGGALWHNYAVRMYLNHDIAIRIGNKHYAYNKTWGDIRRCAPRVCVSTRDGTRKFEAKLQIPLGSGWEPSTDAEVSLPNYKAIQTILSMPILGVTPNDALLCSYFELDYRNAQVMPITSTHAFVRPFVPGMAEWTTLGSLFNVANGAVRIRNLDWRLQQPPLPRCQF